MQKYRIAIEFDYEADLPEVPVIGNQLQQVLMNLMINACLLYTSPSPRDGLLSRMPSSA